MLFPRQLKSQGVMRTQIVIMLNSILTDVFMKLNGVCHPSIVSNTHTNRMYMCSLNVCGLASKLKYNIIYEYIEKFDIICLTETKCLSVDEHDIKEY